MKGHTVETGKPQKAIKSIDGTSMGLKQCCQTPQGNQHTNLSLLSLHPLVLFSVLTIHIEAKCEAAKQKLAKCPFTGKTIVQ